MNIFIRHVCTNVERRRGGNNDDDDYNDDDNKSNENKSTQKYLRHEINLKHCEWKHSI